MAKPGYGKRSMPGQLPRRADDFALLPARERCIAGFIDQLPDGAAMDGKTLAKQLPLYGQQAVGSALRALAAAGYLRRVRCLVGEQGQVRWVSRTFWSRTARDNEWWAATEVNQAAAPSVPAEKPTVEPAEEPSVEPAEAPAAAVAAVVSAVVSAVVVGPAAPDVPEASDAVAAVPRQRTAAAPDSPSPAYLALAQLGRVDARLALSAADCAALEARAAEWLARGVNTDYLIQALSARLPSQVDSPVGFLRRRLTDKIPPHVPVAAAPPAPGAPVHRVMLECTKCGVPGRPDALPDGLCRPCRRPEGNAPVVIPETPVGLPAERDVRTYVAELRDLLKAP